ncbi:13545_t:CDS:2 [Funneliformis mosseae]|uniref:DNA-directed RNA polymerase n=1 Tax=Funneliformis mosseae TaxID=27381 RepID=A0A9N9F938_FUNMO|nr:13545_t:CDS:2 [Funneliformis mosseae]
MPFTTEGITPDLVIWLNVCWERFPLTGQEGDATPFTDVTVEAISQSLRSQGYQSRVFEVMYMNI